MIWKDEDLLAQPQVMCRNQEPQDNKQAGKSAIYTANLFGIYRRQVQRLRHGTSDVEMLED